jgi:hypothetical protein
MLLKLGDKITTCVFLPLVMLKVKLLESSNCPFFKTAVNLKINEIPTIKVKNAKKTIAIFVLLRAISFFFIEN